MPSPNGNIQIAIIGAGIMGQGDTAYATSIPGVKLLAACDCYDGRLQHMKEVYGSDIFTTRDYREIVARKDIDAVIVATPDHWHTRITVDALGSGKHVYCEKPMVHAIEEGEVMIAAQNKSGKVLQIGSQYRSSLVYQKGYEMMQAKAIGKLNTVEAWLDRNSAIGAWEYSIPVDASPKTCDWDQFLGSAPKRQWDPARFFRWRNFRDYGTGVAGDLFVHLLTGIHTVTGSLGPTRVYATGGIRYWTDRDVPDTMLATMDYPETAQHPAFNVLLRVNFKSSLPEESFGLRFIGSDGVMTANSFKNLQITRTPRSDSPDYSIASLAEAEQKQLMARYMAAHPPLSAATMQPSGTQVFDSGNQPAQLDHHRAFYASIREGKPSCEDAVFGFRAAGPALLTNESYFNRRVVSWDPEHMAIART